MAGRAAARVVFIAAALAACHTAPGPAPLITAEPRCADFRVSLYFESDSARLTPEARAVLRTAAARARSCKVSAIDVLGLADASGAPAANLKLSAERARNVTRALARRGLPPLSFGVVAAGAAGAQTPGGADHPLRRRVDVAFHMANSPPTAH